MAVPTRPTLGQLRESLLIRVGMASAGSAPASITPLIDERIRQAQTHLLAQFDFTQLWTLRDFALEAGVSEYDWPDRAEIGDLRRLSVIRGSDGFEVELEPGMRPNERNTLFPSPTNERSGWGTPRMYTIQNRVIRIGPAPDEDWVALRMEYFESQGRLVDDADPCSADPEAILLLAEILVKQHFGMTGWDSLEPRLNTYLQDLQAKQGDGDGFQLGGRQSIRTRPQIRNRALDAMRGGLGAGAYGNHLSW